MKAKQILPIAVIVIVILVLYSSLFVVHEGQQALILRLGEIKANKQGDAVVYKPGLHFKMPVVASVLYFDTRIQTKEVDKSRIVTEQKKDVNVDYYVKWRINNLREYYTATSGIKDRAEQLLQQQTNNALRAEFGKRDIPEVVSDERSQIMTALRETVGKRAQALGLEVIDVRIKTIDLPDEVSSAVFNRMRAERERIAAEHRAEGRSRAEAIKAKADADVTIIGATAKQKAADVMAKGDAQAAKLYADAYNKDASFYAFYKSLQAYRMTMAKQGNVLVLSPKSEFFKYFNNANGSGTSK